MEKGILVVDDHKLFRNGIRTMLEKRPDLKVIAEALDGRSAVSLAKKLRPDLILMDVILPDLNGIEATRQIIADVPDLKILGVSRVADERFAARMLRAGASGYLVKDCGFTDLMLAIDTVLEGEVYLSPDIAGTLVKDFVGSPSVSVSAGVPALTAREREVLQLLAEGKTTKMIAALLFVSAKTVETHRKHIMDKLNIHSVAKLTKYAIREGITALEY